jgi:hypothetical protein
MKGNMLMKSGQTSSVIGRRSDQAIFVQPRMDGLVLNGFAGVGIDSANKKYSKKWRERREKTMPKHIYSPEDQTGFDCCM